MQNKETMNEEAVLMVCLQLLKGEKENKDYGFAVLNESIQVVEKMLEERFFHLVWIKAILIV